MHVRCAPLCFAAATVAIWIAARDKSRLVVVVFKIARGQTARLYVTYILYAFRVCVRFFVIPKQWRILQHLKFNLLD